jgi:succinate dehydrogenase / fumarate reductase iron-sulfur subunit
MSQESSKTFSVRVLRQDAPGKPPYWQQFEVPWEPYMNCISVLEKIAAAAVTADGRQVAPVAWECNCLEEVCGACTMLVNGRARQACTALVDTLLAERPEGIELRPMTKFPVLRDLVVDRARMFAALERIQGWAPVDSYLDMGPGARQSQPDQETAYVLSKCIVCGCCLEACPQYLKIELAYRRDETPEEYDARLRAAEGRGYVGAFAVGQVELFNLNPIGKMLAPQRLDVLVGEGGIETCSYAQNCARVCPKEIPLTTAIARQGRAATRHVLRRWLDG